MTIIRKKGKKYYRRNKKNVFLLIILGVAAYFFVYFDVIEVTGIDKSFHLDMLTINSMFAGFLFTSLGIMISILDKERIKKLDKSGYMDNYINAIYIGLAFHVISIICSLLLIIFSETTIDIWLMYAEQLSLLIGVSFFIKSILNVLQIISMVREG